jgi:stage V sporulation protein B
MSATKNSAYIIAAQVSLLFSGAIINFGLGRMLGPSLYGQFGVVYAVATIINLLLTPGIMHAVAKFSASKKQEAQIIAGSVLKKQFIFGILLAFVYYFLATPIAIVLRDPGLASLMKLLTPLIVIYAISAVYGGYLTGIGKFSKQAAQLMTYSSSRLLITSVLAYFFSLTGAIVALPLAALVALLYFLFASKIKFAQYSTLSLYKFALPITAFIALIAVFLNTDLFLVKALLQDNSLTGYYTAASTIARIQYFVLTALGIVMLPAVAGKLTAKQNAKQFVQGAFRYVIMLLIPSSVIISITAKPLVMLLYRSEYAAAGLPLSVLVIGIAALTLSYLFATVINAIKPALSAATAAGVLALSITLNLALIPRYYLLGAALATTLTSILSMLIMFVIVYRKIGNPINYSSLVKVISASILIFVITVQIDLHDKFLLPVLYAFLGLVYLMTLFVMKELKKEDLKRLLELIPGRFNRLF